MKTTLFFAFILCVNMVSAQWTRISNSPVQADHIYFHNAQTGYALRQDTIFKTSDGGTTWTDLQAGFPPYSTVKKIRFISPDTGLVYVMEGLSFAYPVSIFRTINGGQSWDTILGPYDGSDIEFNMNSQNDWSFHVTSQWVGPAADSIFHTVNGGNSFTRTGNTTKVQYNQQINNLVVYKDSVTFPDQHYLFYKSTNGGATWNLLLKDSTESAGFVDNQFLNSNDGYVLLYQYVTTDTIDSKLYKTTDGGQNWISYDLPAAMEGLQSMHFTDVNTGYILSYASSTNRIYKTIDGGQTWTLDFSGNTNEYFSGYDGMVQYFGKLYVLGNTIITNQVATSVKDLKKDKLNFSLYPNPSVGLLTIKTDSKEKNKEFAIVDITGKEIYAFSTGQNLSQTVDISFLSKGLYLLKHKESSQSVLFVKE
ncbi:MAG: T9SS type A sorting domain-containing protein [Bacteroidota bacterium]